MKQISRNAPCHCGSGKRYKHCHGLITHADERDLPAGTAIPGEAHGSSDALVARGVQAAQNGFLQEAVQLFEQARAVDPASEEVNLNLGTALFQAGRVEESLARIDQALAANPRNLQAMHLRGCALARLNRQLEAITEFDAVIAIAGEEPAVMANRGNCLNMLGRFEESLACFDKALAIDPVNTGALVGKSDALHKLERHAEALACADESLKVDPGLAEALNNRGNALAALRRPTDALASYDRALTIRPDYAEAHGNRGNVLLTLRRPDEALASYDRALTLKPDYAEAHYNRGNALRAQGKLVEAIANYDNALSLTWDYAVAHNNRGNVLLELGKPQEAVASFYAALSIKPDYPEVYCNLATALKDQGKLEEAAASCRNALSINPDYAIAHYNLGDALREQGKLDEAVASYGQALLLQPDYVEAHNNLGLALLTKGNPAEALASFRRALALKPDYVEAHNNLGLALLADSKPVAALESFRRALAFKPDFALAYSNLGNALREQGHLEEAIASCRQALSITPGFAEAHNNMGLALQEQGNVDEALKSFQHALEFAPAFHEAYSNLLYLHAFTRDIAPESACSLAAKWETIALGESARAAACAQRSLFDSARATRRAGRKLRIGVVSAELGQHAVAEFLEPVLEHLDRKRFHLTLYPTAIRTGPRAARLTALADSVKPLVGISDAGAAGQIRSDEIDVLVDTTGHMAGCRLGIFAQRAAPVQCHYIGYHGTTGLTEMDWFIADEVLLPASCDPHFREKIWRLPRLWISYRGDSSLPASRWAPNPQGIITLGSFNNLAKVRHESLSLWARIMNALPESRLLLKDRKAADEAVRNRIRTELSQHGVGSERIDFVSWTPDWSSHMALYDRLDIALDTIPLNSGTTAFDALWMGVPMVALEGDWMGGRMTGAILRALGKPEWIAQNEDDFVAIVTALARDAGARRALRAGQRSLMAGSTLCNAGELTRALEKAFESMFDRHSANRQASI